MKRLIITDPCYLLSDEEWDRACDITGDEWYNGTRENNIEKELSKYFVKNKVASTGFGDWSNEVWIYDERCKIINREFCADSGMVCVILVEKTNKAIKRLFSDGNYNIKDNYIAAVIDLPNDIEIDKLLFEMDKDNKEWTVVEVSYDNELILSSTEEDNDYEEFELLDDEEEED